MKKIYLSLICGIIFAFSIHAQTVFQKAISVPSYPNSTVKNVFPTSDGGYLLATEDNIWNVASLVKTDLNGIVQWSKAISYDSSNVNKPIQVGECLGGGYFILGQHLNAGILGDYFTKTDASGNFLWTKEYPADAYEGVPSIHQAANGDYILSTSGRENGIIHMDSNGNILSSSRYETDTIIPGKTPVSTCAIGSDGGPLICGYLSGIGLTKAGTNGSVQWKKSYQDQVNFQYLFPNDIISTTDGGYALVGHGFQTNSANDESFIIKLDSSGDITWYKQYTDTIVEGVDFTQIDQRPDGQLLVAGVDGLAHAFIGRWDINGNIQSTGIIGNPAQSDYEFQEVYLSATSDNGYVIAGTCFDSAAAITAISIMKTNVAGNFSCYYNSITLQDVTANNLTDVTPPMFKKVYAPGSQTLGTNYSASTSTENDFCLLFSVPEENGSSVSISAYPSPVSAGENFSISISGMEGEATISVYDATGKIVAQRNKIISISPIEIQTNEWSGGIYFIRITNEKNELHGTAKFVVK
jgi:hypothetical protein